MIGQTYSRCRQIDENCLERIFMKKIIPYVYPPIIDTYSGVAGNVAILMTQENTKFLIFRNYYLITYNHTIHAPGFNWLYFDDTFKVNIDIRDELVRGNIVDVIEMKINEGYLVNIYLDHYYLPGTDVYGIAHKAHDVANILGYDNEKKVFIVGDNFYEGKYEIKEVNYADVCRARENIPDAPAYKERNIDRTYIPSKDITIALLRSYMDATCYLSKELLNPAHLELLEQDVEYGVAIYDVMIKQIEDGSIDGTYDIRPFHIVINHMNLYHYFVDLFFDDKMLYSKVNELVEKAILIRNLYIKQCISGRKNEHLIYSIRSLKEQEIAFINEIITVLL